MSIGTEGWEGWAVGHKHCHHIANKVPAFAHMVRSGERGTKAAPATSERYRLPILILWQCGWGQLL